MTQLYSKLALKNQISGAPAPNYAAGMGEGAAIAGELDIVTFKLLFGGGRGGRRGLAKAPEPNHPHG
jgi:hypothetical protein